MNQLDNGQAQTLADNISIDNDEDVIELEPIRLDLETRAADL